MKNLKSDLYKSEFIFIFSKESFRVRGALVTSAFVEGQILLLAKSFLEERGVKHEPKQHQQYRQSLNVLETNGILNSEELDNIENFWKERNKAIYSIFKGMDRAQWEKQNNKVVELGRPIIESLDKKLYPRV